MDTIFKALNDPSRRALLDTLRVRDGQTLQELERHLDMTRFGVMKHLKVLEAAHLVVTAKHGRFKYHYLNAVPLQEVMDRWIEPLVQKPAARGLLDLKARLEGAAPPDLLPPTEIFLRTTVDRLWRAVTQGDEVSRYHPHANVAGALEGAGDELVYLDQSNAPLFRIEVLRLQPPNELDTHLHTGRDAPLPHHFRLIAEAEACRLTLAHPRTPEALRTDWARTLSGLKTWLETGQTTRFAATDAAE
ncbi:MAG: helix-turn-helix domain-containing protein [Pseudomonadota bacterium]